MAKHLRNFSFVLLRIHSISETKLSNSWLSSPHIFWQRTRNYTKLPKSSKLTRKNLIPHWNIDFSQDRFEHDSSDMLLFKRRLNRGKKESSRRDWSMEKASSRESARSRAFSLWKSGPEHLFTLRWFAVNRWSGRKLLRNAEILAVLLIKKINFVRDLFSFEKIIIFQPRN